MATSIPPHNLGEVCDALIARDRRARRVDRRADGNRARPRLSHRRHRLRPRRHPPRLSHRPRHDRRPRPRATSKSTARAASASWSTRFPSSRPATAIEERIAELVNDGRIAGISGIRNESDLKEPVRLILELKRDADPEVVLNQLYQFSPLQDTFSLIFLALVDGKPRVLSFKELLEEFIRHREIGHPPPHAVPAGQGPAAEAHGRRAAAGPRQYRRSDPRDPHLGQPGRGQSAADGDPDARRACCAGPWATTVSRIFQAERGDAARPTRSRAVQADAILRMTLGQLVNLEQEKLAGEHQRAARRRSREYQPHPLRPTRTSCDIIREDLHGAEARSIADAAAHRNQRRGDRRRRPGGPDHRRDDGRLDQPATATSSGRRPRVYRAQHRGGKGLTGAKTEEEDPIEHLFVASTHDYLLFFTNQRQGLLAKGLRPAAVGPRQPRPGGRQPAQLRRRASGSPIAGPSAISTSPTIS